jgi:ribosomal protein S12 methylthiotransferase accessory factor YcaO
MSVTLELSAEVLARLQGEAARRGVPVDQVIAELAAQLPAIDSTTTQSRQPLAFVGAGASVAGITPYMDELLAEGFGRD